MVFVCGPFGNGWPITDLLARFEGRRLIGVDLSMLEPLEIWNPFDLLLERDSSRVARPDVSFASTKPLVPVVGFVLVHPQAEYADGIHDAVHTAIEDALAARDVAVVRIDTRLDANLTGLRSAAQVESLIARMDAVVTTRLHGLVLALKNGVPAVAVDPIAGGAKVSRQAAALGWQHVVAGDAVSPCALADALDACLQPEARTDAGACAERAQSLLVEAHASFIAAVGGG